MSLTKVSYSMIQHAPFNVADYGAVGDGTTDDTAAIQAAIDAAAGVAPVVINEATYLVQPLTLPDNTLIMGNGSRESCVLKLKPGTYANTPGGFSRGVLQNEDTVNGNSNIHIYGITVDGNKANMPSNVGVEGISLIASSGTYSAVAYCSIVNCIIQNTNHVEGGQAGNGMRINCGSQIDICDNSFLYCEGDGLNIYHTCIDITVDNNFFDGNAYLGMETEGRAGSNWTDYRNRRITISNNNFKNIGAGGIGIYGSDNICVDGNEIHETTSGTRAGITCIGSTSVSIVGNAFDSLQDAIQLTSEGLYDQSNRNVTITGNTIAACTNGVHIYSVTLGENKYVIVDANTIRGCTNGIYVEGSQNYYLTFTSNMINNTTGFGIFIDDSAANIYNTIANNTLDTIGSYGIECINLSYSTITGNKVRASTNEAIYLADGGSGTFTRNNVAHNIIADTVASNSIVIENTHTYQFLTYNICDKTITFTAGVTDIDVGNVP